MNNESFEDILIYFSKSLLGKENEEDILWDVATNCISKLGFADCVVFILDENKKKLVQKAAHVPKNYEKRLSFVPQEIAVGEGITGHVVLTGNGEIVKDTSKDPRYIKAGNVWLSEICVPISCGDNTYGVIDCEHPSKSFFSERHLKMLSAIASICAIKIKSVRANKKLLEKQSKLIQVREEMLELKLKTLNSQLNPHFVFNSLNAIQYFITTQNTKLALDYFSTFSKLVRFYLKQLGKDTASLYGEIDLLQGYLKLQKLRYEDSFDYTISIEKDSLESKEAVIPAFVTLMLFENMVEQSIINGVTDQHFKIHLKALKNIVRIEVRYHCKGLGSETLENHWYRENIMKWKDQIELLNAVKGYNISHKTSSSFDDGVHRKHIVIQLPNLA